MNQDFISDCQKAVRIPSESGKEKDVAAFIMTVMEKLGFDEVRIDAVGNVVGRIRGNGSSAVLFEGHMDTVGVGDRADWIFDPFGGQIDCGRIYGRGTSDMKCALIAMVYGAADLIPEKEKLQGDVIVAGVVCEEEFEGVAQGTVLDAVNPDLVVIGEASELNLNIGQRGRAEVVVVTHGKSAHSSNPQAGINAIKNMVRLIPEIHAMKLPKDDFLGAAIIENTDIISEPYPGASVIPSSCRATFDRRLLPGETEEDVLKPIEGIIDKLKKEDKDFSAEVYLARAEKQCYTGITIGSTRFFPAWRFGENEPFVSKVHSALREAGFSSSISSYSFCTDASQSAGVRGIPCLGFGPSKESLAHVADEYILIEELEKARLGYKVIASAVLCPDVNKVQE